MILSLKAICSYILTSANGHLSVEFLVTTYSLTSKTTITNKQIIITKARQTASSVICHSSYVKVVVRANETQFVGMRCKTKLISQYAREGFLTVNTSNRKMNMVVDQNI